MSATGPQRPDHPTWQPPAGPPPGYGPRPLGSLHTPPPAERRPPLLAAALAVALVVLIGVAGGLVLFVGLAPVPTATPIAAPPSPTAGPTPTAVPTLVPTLVPTATPPTSPSPPGSPPAVGRTPPPDVAAQIAAIIEQVPHIRELEPLHDVPTILLSRAEFALELEALLAEEVDLDELAVEERLLKRLGLLPADADLYALFLELYTDQAGAYYRSDTKTMYIIEGEGPFSAIERVFVAHEYTHALQDQHYDLESLHVADPAEGDAAIAQLAAVEGDASLVMMLWAFEHLAFAEQLQLLTSMTPAQEGLLDRMPLVLRRQLEFPYSEGLNFTSEINGHGGWEAVNETLSRAPSSTEQVIHPEKYIADEAPIQVHVPDLAPALGNGWQRAYEQTMGELNTQIWLADGVYPELSLFPGSPEPWREAAAGWGGDRLAMYESENGAWAIVWLLEWDTPADADEFLALAEDLRGTLDGVSALSAAGDRAVRLLVASDQTTLDSLAAAFAG